MIVRANGLLTFCRCVQKSTYPEQSPVNVHTHAYCFSNNFSSLIGLGYLYLSVFMLFVVTKDLQDTVEAAFYKLNAFSVTQRRVEVFYSCKKFLLHSHHVSIMRLTLNTTSMR